MAHDILFHFGYGFDLLIIQVGNDLFDETDRNASGHDLGFAGDDAGCILEINGYFHPGVFVTVDRRASRRCKGNNGQGPDYRNTTIFS